MIILKLTIFKLIDNYIIMIIQQHFGSQLFNIPRLQVKLGKNVLPTYYSLFYNLNNF